MEDKFYGCSVERDVLISDSLYSVLFIAIIFRKFLFTILKIYLNVEHATTTKKKTERKSSINAINH